MRISLEHIGRKYWKSSNSLPKTENGPVKKNERSFDEISINAASPEASERKFADALTKALSADVRTSSTPEEKLNSLKSQIENNTYNVNVNAIASKILLHKGEAVYE